MAVKIVNLMFMLFLSLNVFAEDDHTALKINLANGKTVTLWLGDSPTISHKYNKESEGFEVTVTAQDAVVTFPVEEVLKADFIETPTSIEDLRAEGAESFIFRDGQTAHLSGVNGNVSVYAANGTKMPASVKPVGEGAVDVDIANLPKGIYVISIANGRTYKVSKR